MGEATDIPKSGRVDERVSGKWTEPQALKDSN